ncbi:MAG: sensor histidine kinase KdpD [Legionellales bacterium]|nr:sensor histidine kinase KdpD [Legionellales bacterium]
MSQERSNPEQLLKQVQQEEERSKLGKLKIYLAAAPGVGKTYKMLHDAYQSRLKQLDVVVGIVASHGRQEINNMLHTFEILAPQVVTYRGNPYEEFDLDAALKRNPGLILVDEMAHSNVEGLRHEKRWQDIKELLDRGIDVYTTLNVQHIESLKDDVAQIIQAPVKETVPDFMLERANAIELVDLAVEDLLKRLQEGKIYFPEQVDVAAAHFFRKGNLIALRELALRVTAHWVDTDVRSYRIASGIQSIWPTKDKILVCVGPDSQSRTLIRSAKQLASGLQAEWIAVYVDKPSIFLAEGKRNLAIKNLRLAEQLGATTHVLPGRDIVQALLKFAREANVTQMMLSKDRSQAWRYMFRRRLADEVMKHCGEISVTVVGSHLSPEPYQLSERYSGISWPYYWLSLATVALVTGIGLLLNPFLTTNGIALFYILGVIMVALVGRPGPAVLTSILSVVGYDYFFVSPMYQLKILSVGSLVTMGMMFVVSLVISYFMVLQYREAKIARQVQQQTRTSYDFGQKLLRTRGRKDILSLGTQYIAQSLSAHVLILVPKNEHLEVQTTYPDPFDLNEKELAVAQWVYEMAQPAGLGTDTLSSATALYFPLHTASQPAIGVLRIQPQEKTLLSADQLRILDAFVNQLALALEIDHLQEKFRKKQVKLEVASAKNALLKTISQQLNYPLRFILEELSPASSQKPHEQSDFDVHEELTKISLVNNNILQMIEFETHHIQLEKTNVDLPDLIQQTIQQFRKVHHQRTIQVQNPTTLPKLSLDPARIRMVFLNLLDNSIKYSRPLAVIDIRLERQEKHVLVSVENSGSEIATEDLPKIFNPFYRKTSSYYQSDSLGLGLTLCRINIEAHGGKIWAENLHKKGGVALRFTLPW